MSRALGYIGKKKDGKDKPCWNPKQKKRDPDAMDINFTQLNSEEKEQLMKTGSCFRCKKQGHRSRECPSRRKTLICEATSEPTTESSTSKGKAKETNDDPPSYDSLLKKINTCSMQDRQKILEVFSQDGDEGQEDF